MSKLTPKQKKEMLNVIDGRMLLVKTELEDVKNLLLTDLETVKKWIKNL